MLFPAKMEGAQFLVKYNAWGYVRPGRKTPYLALHVGSPKSGVLYFGEVESMTQPFTSKEDAIKGTGIKEKDMKLFSTGKRVVILKPGTLVEFKDPIKLLDKHTAPRGLRYTTLQKIMEAKCVADL